MPALSELSAAELSVAYARGDLSPVEVAEAELRTLAPAAVAPKEPAPPK